MSTEYLAPASSPRGAHTRAAVFVRAHQPAELAELLIDPPGPGEVRVRMLAAGVCRSDLHVVDGDWTRPTGVVLGHEGAAEIETVGPGVELAHPELQPGTLVSLAWVAPCRSCPSCRSGRPWQCGRPIGSPHRLAPELVRLHRLDGAPVGAYNALGTFAELEVVAAEAAIPIDPRTPPAVAAMISCAGTTGVGAVLHTAQARAGESIAIVGLGGVGMSALLGARLVGAHPIAALDTRPDKLERARDLGADATVLVDPDDMASVTSVARAASGGRGFDYVLECVGAAAALEFALELGAPGGTIVAVGLPAEGTAARLDGYAFVKAGRRLIASYYGSSDPATAFPDLSRLYLAGRLPLDRLIGEQVALADVNEAIDALRRGDGLRSVVQFPSVGRG
jgi:S-(hydroxymethyl)glutathione dehydrogenase/alcohol dehydrogenase